MVDEASSTSVHDRIRTAIRKVGAEVFTLKQMENWDETVKGFSIRTASARDYVEALEASLESAEYPKRAQLIWEMQRLAAMAEKLMNQREERSSRIRELDAKHREHLDALRGKMEAAETRLRSAEADLAGCERALAQEPAPNATTKQSENGTTDAEPSAAIAVQRAAGSRASAGQTAEVPHVPQPPPGGARPPPPPIPDGAFCTSPPVSAPPPGLSTYQRSWPQAVGAHATAQVPDIPPGGEGSDVDIDDDNPWASLN